METVFCSTFAVFCSLKSKYLDRHENEDKPLVETWLMRPNNDIVEFHIILQNYQLVFEILPNGNVNLIEKVN